MARGRKCPQCGTFMNAVNESEQPKGKWITYQCRNGKCKYELREFEAK